MPRNLKAVSSVFVATLALGLAAYLLWQRSEFDGNSVPKETARAPAGQTMPEAKSKDVGAANSSAIRQPGSLAGDLAKSGQEPLENSQKAFPPDQTIGEYRGNLWKAILEDPPNLAKRGDPEIDGDTAYRHYLLFRWCGSVPTTERAADVHFQQWADEIADATDEEQLRGLKWHSGRDFRLYEFCRAIPPEVDRRLESVRWLGEAVRLNHEVAQIEYYESVIQMLSAYRPGFISSSLIMLHPELLNEFKDTTRPGLARAMESGHPEAFVIMSQAVIDGVVYPRDPALAYAYAHLAELVAGQDLAVLGRIDRQKFLVSQYVDIEQIAEAEATAQTMNLEKTY